MYRSLYSSVLPTNAPARLIVCSDDDTAGEVLRLLSVKTSFTMNWSPDPPRKEYCPARRFLDAELSVQVTRQLLAE